MDEEVVCLIDGRWLQCRVCQLFPYDYLHKTIDQRELPEQGVPAYRCKVKVMHESDCVKVDNDTDDYIKKHSTTFRFSVGDAVCFATEKAIPLSKRHCT